MTNETKCSECDNTITLESVEIGDVTECPVCGVNLEVTNLEPLKVEAVFLNK